MLNEIITKLQSRGFPYNKALSTSKELRFNRKGSLSIDIEKGVYYDHETGKGGSLGDFNISQDTNPRPMKSSCEIEADKERNRRYAENIWRQTKPVENTLAETYLREIRGLKSCSLPATLRFHPALYHKQTGERFPAMIGIVQDIKTGNFKAVHRTYLEPETANKAEVQSPKSILATISGGGLLIGKPCGKLIIGEGVETTLSLHQETGYSAIAALSASNMKKLQLPQLSKVQEIIIGADNDANRTGINAAKELAEKAVLGGYSVKIITPPDGYKDFNDILTGNKK